MKYFTIDELSYSAKAEEKGIKNIPNEMEVWHLQNLVEKVLDPVRERFGKPIYVNSGYRCKELNRVVKGSITSQHLTGQAVDITASQKEDNKKIFDIIVELGLYDQLIWERGDVNFPQWIHVSYREPMRKEKLRTKDGVHYTKMK